MTGQRTFGVVALVWLAYELGRGAGRRDVYSAFARGFVDGAARAHRRWLEAER